MNPGFRQVNVLFLFLFKPGDFNPQASFAAPSGEGTWKVFRVMEIIV
jgi:hypothetical protein